MGPDYPEGHWIPIQIWNTGFEISVFQALLMNLYVFSTRIWRKFTEQSWKEKKLQMISTQFSSSYMYNVHCTVIRWIDQKVLYICLYTYISFLWCHHYSHLTLTPVNQEPINPGLFWTERESIRCQPSCCCVRRITFWDQMSRALNKFWRTKSFLQ